MMEKNYIVYLHINKINKKVYVGITHYISNKLKGRKRKPESINATVISRKLKNNYNRNPYWLRRPMGGRNNPMFGKHLSEEVKSKKKYKKILQFNKNGEFIKEYESIKAASVALSISSTNIVSALKGRSKTAANYIWRYKYE